MEENNNISSRYDAVAKQASNFGIDAQRWYTVYDLKCKIAIELGADVQDVKDCLSVYDVDYLIYKTYGGTLSKLDLMSDYDVLVATIAILDSGIDTSLIDSEFTAEMRLINLIVPMTNEYFYLEPLSDNTEFTINSVEGAPVLNLEYSSDGKRWQNWDYMTNCITANAMERVYLRGQNEEWTTIVDSDESTFGNHHYNSIISVSNEQFNIGGRLSSLFTGNEEESDKSIIMSAIFHNSSCGDASKLIVPKNAKMSYAFTGCSSLISAPWTLSDSIQHINQYRNMFQDCTSLTKAPVLPATSLKSYCYYSMFRGCTSLTEAPVLPATSLKSYCYKYMFKGCTSLTKAPELPATSLVPDCYVEMFRGCTSLTEAPVLPATSLVSYCYHLMFDGCTSLTKAPELPATSLESSCYQSMFSGCTSLTKAPELPATSLKPDCYDEMFGGCTSLTEAPVLPATSLAQYCYSDMFRNCTSLTKAPELPATSLKLFCYLQMFSGCSSLTEAPVLPATSLAQYCYQSMFRMCTSLTSFNFGDQSVFADLANSISYMFYGCKNLSYIRCLFDDRDGAGPREYTNWTNGVAPQGTFVTNVETWKRGPNGIPSGWDVVIEGTTA